MTKDVKDHYSCWKQFCLGKYIMCQGGLCPLFWWGSWVPSNTVAWAEAYLRTKWHLNPSSRWATIGMGWKLGACAPLWEDELGPHLTQYGHGRGLPHANFHFDPSNRLATIHQCLRQNKQRQDRTMVWWHRANRFTNGCPPRQTAKYNEQSKKNWKTIITGN